VQDIIDSFRKPDNDDLDIAIKKGNKKFYYN